MAGESLKGQLLVAAPALADPNFRRTVVLVIEHSEEGALGLVLNRPSDLTAVEAVPMISDLLAAEVPLYVGGPVQPDAVIAIGEYTDTPEVAVFGPIGPVDLDEQPDGIGEQISRIRLFAGYAGWGPGQLEGELEEDAWFVEPALPGDVFCAPDPPLWNGVLRRMGGRFRLVATMPDDPGLN